MDFTAKAKLVADIVNREMSIYNLQLGHRSELPEHQYRVLMQQGTFSRRRSYWAKSLPELKKRLKLMNINNTLLAVQADG